MAEKERMLSVKIPHSLYRKLTIHCARIGKTKKEIITRLVEREINNKVVR